MKKKFKSVRTKLFITLCIVVLMIIAFLIIVNNVVLETIYYHSKKEASLNTYEYINNNLPKTLEGEGKGQYELELEKIAIDNNFEIIILDEDNEIYLSNKNFLSGFGNVADIKHDVKYSIFSSAEDIMYASDGVNIRRIQDKINGRAFILLSAELDNGNKLYIRMPTTPIKESVGISNNFLYILAFVSVAFGGIAITFITEKFTKPIEQLNDIANRMSKLDFGKKYKVQNNEDEINELGTSINILSNKLEETINKLKMSNMELEKDMESKSKIDEMRKQFISDVSHELKTPISLIQGYAEGLLENVNTDEENRKFYSEVILDEANKMDKLVKRLLELMKLEYEDTKFNNTKFDIVELINEVVKNSKVILDEQKIDVEFKENEPINVYADDFYIEQVITNYFTNAIKNIKEIDGKKLIKISIKKGKEQGKLRVCVFNTGKNIDEENLNRIWTRFYKTDESRNRTKGGTGIGLALVKAIMNKYNSKYGVVNKKDGVEFYFEIKV